MAILNYTTKIDINRTAAEIQKILAAHGAKAVQVDYTNGLLLPYMLVGNETIYEALKSSRLALPAARV